MELCHHNFVLNLIKESLLNIEKVIIKLIIFEANHFKLIQVYFFFKLTDQRNIPINFMFLPQTAPFVPSRFAFPARNGRTGTRN